MTAASRLTLGTAQLGMPYGVANALGKPADSEAQALLERAFALGVNSFDTAPAYGDAEDRLGSFLSAPGRRELVVVTTKVSPQASAGVAADRIDDSILRSIEGSVRRLRTTYVDHLLLHAAEDLHHYQGRLVDALLRVKARGLARNVGVSAYLPDDARALISYSDLTSIQLPLNLVDQRLVTSGILADVAARGTFVFARSVFLQGLLTLDPGRLPDQVRHAEPTLRALAQLCMDHGTSPMAAALPWAVSIDGVTSVVIGVDTIAQLEANVAAVADAVPPGLSEDLRSRFAAVDPRVLDPSCWEA